MGKTCHYIRAAMRDGGAVFYITPIDDGFTDAADIDGELRRRGCQLTAASGGGPQRFAAGTYEVQALSEDQVGAVRQSLRLCGWRIAVMASWPEYDEYHAGGKFPLPFDRQEEMAAETRSLVRRLGRAVRWPFSVDYVAATPRELMTQGAWEKARDMLGWGQWVFDSGLRSLDEQVYLTAEQAAAAGFKPARPWIQRWWSGA